ncbi:MAG: AbrB/MazE/SpoVT family DNA-binding domain-containing protein [Candidatus Hydrogenedentes bacterium]|nr:AbrB/MazE/SpoVT family DNA-binding domain-containing protein [Candidatus Hydrogenedentota bacterium]
MEAIVADSGQVIIPEKLRNKLGIMPQTILDFREENGTLVATKVEQDDPVSRVTGCIKLDMPTDEFLNLLRGGTRK